MVGAYVLFKFSFQITGRRLSNHMVRSNVLQSKHLCFDAQITAWIVSTKGLEKAATP